MTDAVVYMIVVRDANGTPVSQAITAIQPIGPLSVDVVVGVDLARPRPKHCDRHPFVGETDCEAGCGVDREHHDLVFGPKGHNVGPGD